MLKRHKDMLRPLVANLRARLAGSAGADGAWQRGDLDRELERLGIAPDGGAIPLDALPNATPAERRALPGRGGERRKGRRRKYEAQARPR
jgi:hypothetical protein